MTDVVVVGSINVDMVSYLDRWPVVGETVAAQETKICLGGKGANQAIAAARLGASVRMIGAIGSDELGRDVANRLRAADVQLSLREKSDKTSGMAFIDVGPDGGNIIRLSEGANKCLTAANVHDCAADVTDAKVLLIQNEVPLEASLAAARVARANGLTVIMDPAPAPVPFWNAEVLSEFDIITPNAHEAHLMLGALPKTLQAAEHAAARLRTMGPRGAIVTMGASGVGWSIGSCSGHVVAPNVPAIDTVAAGDCFNGAFATFLSRGACVEEAISFAVDAAALATTRRGAADAMPSGDELREFNVANHAKALEIG
ncbi:ribokinase [Roseobacter sp. EG26]|uniref:ribokinase n=1 Tax=Roseobacter sp. EG26 TaxID=3412477 RepID=UPI003CE58DD0